MQDKANRRNDVRNMQGKDEFPEAAVDKMKGWNGVNKDEDDRGKQKEERRKRKREVDVNDESDNCDCADHAHRDIKQVIAESLFLLRGFTFDQRLIVRTENFAQKRHAGLCKQGHHQA